jgi:hypothetical protein
MSKKLSQRYPELLIVFEVFRDGDFPTDLTPALRPTAAARRNRERVHNSEAAAR